MKLTAQQKRVLVRALDDKIVQWDMFRNASVGWTELQAKLKAQIQEAEQIIEALELDEEDEDE